MSVQALEPLIAKLIPGKPNQQLILPKGEYSVSGQQILVNLPGLTIKATPDSILHAPLTHSVWEIHCPNVTIDGFTCPAAGVYFHSTADGCKLLNATLGFGGVLQQAVLCDSTGTNLLVQDVLVDVTNAQTIYLYASKAVLRRVQVRRGSWGEYSVRISSVSDSTHRPCDILIDACEFSNLPASMGGPNGPGKPVVGVRNGDGVMQNSIIHGWMGAGETNDPILPGTNCNFKLTANQFDSLPTEHSYVELRGGTLMTDGGNNKFNMTGVKPGTEQARTWAIGAGGKLIPFTGK